MKASETAFEDLLSNSSEGMLLFDRSVDPKEEVEVLERYHYPFIPLNVDGYMIPALETDDARYVGTLLIERYLKEWSEARTSQ